ncbi:MAG: twin-arginine translocation signal domain-containing protein, partial [Sulfurovum sp.]
HGVWENMYDHENSHLDQRFMASAGPVGAYVVSGPVEPFYDTLIQSS